MHYYIYPKNWDGEDIAENISYLGEGSTYSFIDDSLDGLRLDDLAQEIRENSNSLVLISSKYRYFDLIKNLEVHGIDNYVDGLKFSANKINEYFLKRGGGGAHGCLPRYWTTPL